MDACYEINDASQILSPSLVVFLEILEANIDKMMAIAGSPERLRPHCKTHKMREVVRMQVARGVTRHKAATFAEAEMLASAGAKDVFLAYSLVGPNIGRAVRFRQQYPEIVFSVTADHAKPIERLGAAMQEAGQSIEVLLDLDTGQHRTGVETGERAKQLYQQLVETPGVSPGGLHLYDGQNHQTNLEERRAAVLNCWKHVSEFRDELVAAGWSVPRIVAGGTGSFPIYATLEDDALQLSPGTCVFHDIGYGRMFPDLDFKPAALLLTRVISRPTQDRLTLDLGYKAVASDPPADRRVVIPDLPDAQLVLQNEEHLVVESSLAEKYEPGDELLAIPRHVCPTSALHKRAYVVHIGKLVDCWDVAARDRVLTI
ncbi:MAG: D-TA family PLP-dependent enzyme [Pirellulaceae bacterium]|jgi:D-serine deaminase-like pyridoxal phosphate-dependent protein|nr:D-TA family PLP-dependent enzyme [Pirellulaceae bacterium]